MLTYNNKEYRNLEEQVLKNQDDIEALINKANISNLGINIVTAVPFPTADQLPLPYDGQYGDGFLVGTAAPYDLYIWTRESNEYNGEWFDWGPLNAPSVVPGPIGPQGIQGEQGIRGSFWYSQSGVPTQIVGVNNNDQALDGNTGDIFQFNNGIWIKTGNIRGPQGIQGIQGLIGPIGPMGPRGPQGETGAQGQFIEIIGTLDNINQLPDPTTVARSAAYLVPVSGAEHVFLIIGQGTTTDPLTWHDAGGFGGGTGITINGVPQASLDLTNDVTIPNYASTIDSSASIAADSVTFNNLEVTGKNPGGSDITPAQASIQLPIKASENIEPKVIDNELAFDITQTLMDKIEQDIADAKPPEVVINAPVTATNGQLTEAQLTTLQENKGAYLFFNNEIYRLQDTQHVAGYLIYSHVGYQNTANMYVIKCITITISTRGWVLTTRDVVNGNDYYTKTQADNRYVPKSTTGTTIIASTGSDTPIDLKGNESDAYIGFRDNTNAILGYIGIDEKKRPRFENNVDGSFILPVSTYIGSGDANTIINSGVYGLGASVSNRPTSQDGYLIVIRWNDNENYCTQIYVKAGGSGEIFTRCNLSSTGYDYAPWIGYARLNYDNSLTVQANNGFVNNSNEFNFAGNMSAGSDMYYLYRGTPSTIYRHIFSNGQGDGGLAEVNAAGYQVNGTEADLARPYYYYITGTHNAGPNNSSGRRIEICFSYASLQPYTSIDDLISALPGQKIPATGIANWGNGNTSCPVFTVYPSGSSLEVEFAYTQGSTTVTSTVNVNNFNYSS